MILLIILILKLPRSLTSLLLKRLNKPLVRKKPHGEMLHQLDNKKQSVKKQNTGEVKQDAKFIMISTRSL
ncbi:hypothetical protein LDENG_00123930 [Lucifuga dentata]|nr:hypothetical protein LDENG_00123930 [Lucifuga dentata]